MNIGIELNNDIEVKRIYSAFAYDFLPSFDYSGESHSGWEFVYVQSGSIFVTADDMTYILKKGEMVCHKPMEFHSLKPYNGEASAVVFCFDCDSPRMKYFFNKILTVNLHQKNYINEIAEASGAVFRKKNPLQISRDGGMERAESSNAIYEQILKNAIELLILSTMSAHSTERKKRAELYEQSLQRSTLTQDIIGYMTDNISQNIRLSDLSNRFSYSVSSIKRIFKEETGESIIDYLTAMRIDRAAELLEDTSLTVTAIADNLGFSNVFYFSNVFKSKKGISPNRYKAECKKSKEVSE